MRLSRVAIGSLVVVAAVGIAAAIGFSALERYLETPLAIAADSHALELPPGTSFARVTRQLAADGVLEHPRVLELYARYTGDANRIKAGEYSIPRGVTPAGLVERLVDGDVVTHEVTLIEGRTFREALAAVQAHPAIVVTLDGLDDAAIMAKLGHPGEHPEGRFFPDTYTFTRGATDLSIMERARKAMDERLADAWASRAENLPLDSPYEALILASIVEKETALASERAAIAGVFTRRLKLGMRLQTDPTVIYGLGAAFDGDIRRRDLTTDTPYNTYTRAGLPPTPIALPGAGALTAAVQPEETNALYFVATGDPDGSHYFSSTLAEHNRAVQRYLARLRGRP